MKFVPKGIISYDFNEIDVIVLKSNEIKHKHIFHPSERVPSQGSPFVNKVTTIKSLIKNHHKKLR